MELPGTGATDEQCLAAKESRLQHGPPGVKPEVLFDRPQLCTIPALGRRIDWDGPGVRGPVDCRTGVPYHHVLNRARWSSLQLSRTLLFLLLRHLDSGIGPLVFGIDETIERRRGKRISAKGIYRDGVRSSQGHFVKASGLRWVSLMWLAPIPWAGRVWALPFLTVLAPSERFHRERGQRHKKLTDWARQMILQLRRWLPRRPLVLVADSSYAVLDLLHFCQFMASPVTFITRLRLDAALYEPVPPRSPGQLGRPRLKGKRLPTLKDLLGHPTTLWNTVTVDWYDNTPPLAGNRLPQRSLVSSG